MTLSIGQPLCILLKGIVLTVKQILTVQLHKGEPGDEQQGDGHQTLFRYTFQPLHHAEHHTHRDEAYDKEYRPALPDGPLVVHQRTNPQQQVTYRRRTQP